MRKLPNRDQYRVYDTKGQVLRDSCSLKVAQRMITAAPTKAFCSSRGGCSNRDRNRKKQNAASRSITTTEPVRQRDVMDSVTRFDDIKLDKEMCGKVKSCCTKDPVYKDFYRKAFKARNGKLHETKLYIEAETNMGRQRLLNSDSKDCVDQILGIKGKRRPHRVPADLRQPTRKVTSKSRKTHR